MQINKHRNRNDRANGYVAIYNRSHQKLSASAELITNCNTFVLGICYENVNIL